LPPAGGKLCEAFLTCSHGAFLQKRAMILWQGRFIALRKNCFSIRLVLEENYWWIRVPVLPAIPWQPCSHGAFLQKRAMILWQGRFIALRKNRFSIRLVLEENY